MHANESQHVLKRVAKKVSRLFLFSAAGLILSHGVLQFHNIVTNYKNLAYPTLERAAFRKTFSFPIEGYEEDIEKNQYTIPVISAVFHKERIEKSFSLNSVYIRPESYFKKTVFDQFEHLFDKSPPGRYNSIQDKVILDTTNFRPLDYINHSPQHKNNTLIARLNTHHEIKHDKTGDLMLTRKPILKEWTLLAQDDTGKKIYRGKTAESTREDLRQEDEYYGFVSTYARKNVEEDIAETCSRAECVEDIFSDQFIKWLYDKPHQRISRKIKLAQDYRLIPTEFTEYVGILKQYRDLNNNDLSELLIHAVDSFINGFLSEKANPYNPVQFMKDTSLFFKNHPHSVYTINLRQKRGDLFHEHAKIRKHNALFLKAQEEYKKGLAAQYKEPHTYQEILKNLAECSDALKENVHAQKYRDARKEYERRMYGMKDPNIALTGVEDILVK